MNFCTVIIPQNKWEGAKDSLRNNITRHMHRETNS